MDQAVYEQADLLAEFEKIADELNTVLANMEGSTLVKRLKSASREQNKVAERIGSRIDALFGKSDGVKGDDSQLLTDLADVEKKSSVSISYIMDDMQSYFERRRMNQFKVVLDDMRKSEVTAALQQISEELPKEHGMSIAQAEYWSDTLDRWAEDLVDPACSGSCPGCKTSDALPPSLILEVLQILEGEVNLREATRVADQAKPGLSADKHLEEATKLSETQLALKDRTKAVVQKIQELPDGDKRFPKEIALLSQVKDVMFDAEKRLHCPRPAHRPSLPKPKRLSCCCNANASIPMVAEAAVRLPAAVAAVRRRTLPWRCLEQVLTKTRNASTAKYRRHWRSGPSDAGRIPSRLG